MWKKYEFYFAVNEIWEELKRWKNSDIWKSEHLKMRIFEYLSM